MEDKGFEPLEPFLILRISSALYYHSTNLPLFWDIQWESNPYLSERYQRLYSLSYEHHFLAENVGFEPTELLHPTTFQAATFDHSVNSPNLEEVEGLEPSEPFLILRISSALHYQLCYTSIFWGDIRDSNPQLLESQSRTLSS